MLGREEHAHLAVGPASGSDHHPRLTSHGRRERDPMNDLVPPGADARSRPEPGPISHDHEPLHGHDDACPETRQSSDDPFTGLEHEPQVGLLVSLGRARHNPFPFPFWQVGRNRPNIEPDADFSYSDTDSSRTRATPPILDVTPVLWRLRRVPDGRGADAQQPPEYSRSPSDPTPDQLALRSISDANG
jgi:hypothetical protein